MSEPKVAKHQLYAGLILAAIFLIGIYVFSWNTDHQKHGQVIIGSPGREDVVRVASRYIRDKYPAVESIDEETAIVNNIWIGKTGGEWEFAVAVKGKNSYGVPTKNAVAGALEWGGGDMWKLKALENQAMGALK